MISSSTVCRCGVHCLAVKQSVTVVCSVLNNQLMFVSVIVMCTAQQWDSEMMDNHALFMSLWCALCSNWPVER